MDLFQKQRNSEKETTRNRVSDFLKKFEPIPVTETVTDVAQHRAKYLRTNIRWISFLLCIVACIGLIVYGLFLFKVPYLLLLFPPMLFFLYKKIGLVASLFLIIILEAILFFSISLPILFFVHFACAILVIFNSVDYDMRAQLMREFAQEHGFTYSKGGYAKKFDSSVFQKGSNGVIYSIDGKISEVPISLFRYEYSTHENRRSACEIYQLTFDSTLKMPNILIISREYTNFKEFHRLFSPYKTVRLELEGNFNNLFMFSVEKGYERTALEIFTPDVMSTVIDISHKFSFEIINNTIYIYAPSMDTKKDLEAIHTMAIYCIEKIGPKLKRINKSTATMRTAMMSIF